MEDLKVLELKEELGKRGLQKAGKKQALIKRLLEAILTEQLQDEVRPLKRVSSTKL